MVGNNDGEVVGIKDGGDIGVPVGDADAISVGSNNGTMDGWLVGAGNIGIRGHGGSYGRRF